MQLLYSDLVEYLVNNYLIEEEDAHKLIEECRDEIVTGINEALTTPEMGDCLAEKADLLPSSDED